MIDADTFSFAAFNHKIKKPAAHANPIAFSSFSDAPRPHSPAFGGEPCFTSVPESFQYTLSVGTPAVSAHVNACNVFATCGSVIKQSSLPSTLINVIPPAHSKCIVFTKNSIAIPNAFVSLAPNVSYTKWYSPNDKIFPLVSPKPVQTNLIPATVVVHFSKLIWNSPFPVTPGVRQHSQTTPPTPQPHTQPPTRTQTTSNLSSDQHPVFG